VKTLSWVDGHGKEVRWEIKPTLATDDFRDAPGHALLLVAANRHLSVSALERLLRAEGIGRSRSWIQRRRWLFQDPDAIRSVGEKSNADGQDTRAVAVMRENPTLSLRGLSKLLDRHGIARGKDWVRQHRCD
jgi:hypothetical protein